MAAKYSRIFRSIWRDTDFIALPSDAQRLYMLLFSQPDISACGVLPLLVARWANLAADTDADSVQAALTALTAGPKPFVVTDDGTLEAWVRGYLKFDELYKVPNGRKSIDSSLDTVVSPLLRQQIETVYVTLTETLDATHAGTDGPPQQPAASSQPPHHTPAAATSSPTEPGDKFRAVIECMVSLRLQQEKGIRNATRYKAALRRDFPTEHGDTVTRLIAQFPEAPTSSIAAAALTGDTRQLGAYA